MLPKILKSELQRRDLSVRDAAKEIGVAHTTIFRMLAGEHADLPTLEKLSKWMNIPVTTLITSSYEDGDTFVNKFAMVVEREPKIANAFQQAMDCILAGEISEEDILDIVSYTTYKLTVSRRCNKGINGTGISINGEKAC
jgi:transcriptional regulator with XRE-family HTH domain